MRSCSGRGRSKFTASFLGDGCRPLRYVIEHNVNTLWAPAAAISSARLALACPRTSVKSRSAVAAASAGGAGVTATWTAPFRKSTASRKVGAASTLRSSTASASLWFASGTTSVPMRRRRQVSPTASTPRTPWIWPFSASSPTTANEPMRPSTTTPVAARIPSAIGRSNDAPSLRRSAGARLTVIRSDGNAKPAFRMAVRTRSRLSRTAESGRPTVVNAGNSERTYPVKWQLKDANGNYVTDLASSTSLQYSVVSCGAFAGYTTDVLAEATATGRTVLRYDTTSNQFI